MALTLGDNFSYQGAKPLDARLKYDTLAAMKAVADSTMYDGCLAYCVATDKTYQWKSTNEVDPDTGKWIEYSSGGGHEIKNNGVAVTDRKVMNFTDFDIADDSTNEETDIKAHRLTQAEMSEIMSTLPGTPTELPVMFDEADAEHVVGWYKYANGTKQPVYIKNFFLDKTTMANVPTDYTTYNFATLSNIKKIVSLDACLHQYQTGDLECVYSVASYYSDPIRVRVWYRVKGSLAISWEGHNPSIRDYELYTTITYTKTTDTPV